MPQISGCSQSLFSWKGILRDTYMHTPCLPLESPKAPWPPGACVAILILLSASLLVRLVDNCSGVTALGSGYAERTHYGEEHQRFLHSSRVSQSSQETKLQHIHILSKMPLKNDIMQKHNERLSDWVLTLPDLHDDLHSVCVAHTSLSVLQTL